MPPKTTRASFSSASSVTTTRTWTRPSAPAGSVSAQHFGLGGRARRPDRRFARRGGQAQAGRVPDRHPRSRTADSERRRNVKQAKPTSTARRDPGNVRGPPAIDVRPAILAFQADLTRVSTLMIAAKVVSARIPRSHPRRPSPAHAPSQQPRVHRKVTRINTHHVQLFSDLYSRK